MINRAPLVLHVEDDLITQALIRRLLEAYGFDVIGASDNFEAMRAVCQYAPDCIVFDLMLGDANGVDVAQRLKSVLEHEERLPPFIALSASLAARRRAVKSGLFAEVLSKPVCGRQLAETIIRHIRRIPTEPVKRERARAARLHPIGAALTRIDENVRR